MSQIMNYFFHNILVFSIYNDVVLILSNGLKFQPPWILKVISRTMCVLMILEYIFLTFPISKCTTFNHEVTTILDFGYFNEWIFIFTDHLRVSDIFVRNLYPNDFWISSDKRIDITGLNSSRPGDAYMRQYSISALVQTMACRRFGAKPLSEPMLPYFQLNTKEHILMKFYSKFEILNSGTCTSNECRLWNGGHFVSASMCNKILGGS